MKIYINDTAMELDSPARLTQVLERYQPEPPYVVAVNGQFVPRGQYDATELAERDRIDLVSPRQGG